MMNYSLKEIYQRHFTKNLHSEGQRTRINMYEVQHLNALPEDVTSSKSEHTFRRQIKTWLFKKSFPDIII